MRAEIARYADDAEGQEVLLGGRRCRCMFSEWNGTVRARKNRHPCVPESDPPCLSCCCSRLCAFLLSLCVRRPENAADAADHSLTVRADLLRVAKPDEREQTPFVRSRIPVTVTLFPAARPHPPE